MFSQKAWRRRSVTHFADVKNVYNIFDCLWILNRGSYLSAHVLLNLLNELGKRDKKRGLPSILSHFRNEFNKFNDTRARMLDSIYHNDKYFDISFLA